MGSRRVLVDSIRSDDGREIRIALSDITDLRDAEEVQHAMEARMRSALELSGEAAEHEQEKLELLFDQLPVGVSVLDSEGRLVKHNRRLEEILGLEPGEFDAKAYLRASYVDRDGRPIAREDMPGASVITGAAPAVSREMRMIRSWGSPVELLVNAVATPLPGWSVIVITMDIGELKRAEQALREREQEVADAYTLNRSILDTSPIGILTYNEQGQCITANRAAAAMLGGSVEQLLAQNYHQLGYWKDQGLVEAAERIGAHGGEAHTDLRLSSPFRKEFWASLRLAAFTVNGKRHILVFLTDISERKQAEAALRESEARYRLLFENAGIGIAIYAGDGRVISFNKRAAAHMGGSPADFEGRNLKDFFPSDEAEKYILRLRQALESPVAIEFEDSVDLPSGNKRFLSVHAAIRLPDGSALGVQVIGHDITERIESENRDREHRQQLIQAEKLASLGTLVAGVAHEINNPNHAIMLNTELVSRVWSSLAPVLDRHFADDEESLVGGIEYRELRTLLPGIIQGTMDSAAAIDDIVRGLKDFSSPDMSSHSDEIDMNLAIRGAVALISSLIKRSTKHFSLRLASGLPHVKGSFQRLEQVMINLLQNSCQALADPGQEISVESSWDEESGEVVVQVLDSGRGMGAAELSQIKDPFFTTRRSQGGTGLGLSITNSIIEEHRGSLSFASEPGVGTRVSIRIPAARRPEHEERP
jgi:PAS domain S-box-containing protein